MHLECSKLVVFILLSVDQTFALNLTSLRFNENLLIRIVSLTS